MFVLRPQGNKERTINSNNIIVFDFETWSLNTKTLEPVQLACLALDSKTLSVIPGSEFCSLIRPIDKNNWQQGAIDCNGITPDKVENAPTQESVWAAFWEHVKKYRSKGGITGRPIAAGKNIRHFDLPIIQRLATTYKNVDKDGTQNLFNQRTVLDLEDLLFNWFWHTEGEIANYRMDTIRPYFGLDVHKNHDAARDCAETAQLIVRFLKLQRALFPKIGFKGSCRPQAVTA